MNAPNGVARRKLLGLQIGLAAWISRVLDRMRFKADSGTESGETAKSRGTGA